MSDKLRDRISNIVFRVGAGKARTGVILNPDEVADAILADWKGWVVPLVWESPSAGNNWIYQAHSPWGTYGIHICGGRHQAWLESNAEPHETWLGDGYLGSVIEAQVVANDHYVSQVFRVFGVRGEV